MVAVVSIRTQRLVTTALLSTAGLIVILGIVFRDDRPPESAVALDVATNADGLAISPAESGGVVSPVEGWFPQSGAGSACREPVGIDLIGGYGATLTVNGISIPDERMNVKLDDDGNPTKEVTASRSLGHYTFGPEEACPNGAVLRATDNVIEACVYRLVEGPEVCVTSEYRFDLA